MRRLHFGLREALCALLLPHAFDSEERAFCSRETKMDHPNASQASFAHLNQLHNSQLHNRRLRPPDLETMGLGDENRTPLRPNTERPRRRDSKLLGLFSRQKSTADLPMPQPQPQPAFSSSARELELPPRGGLRASLAEISHWPYALQSTRSEAALLDPTIPSQLSPSPAHHRPPPPPKPIRSPSFKNNSMPVPNPPSLPPARSTRGALATWDPPPLFQGYPQAIRYIELPACTQSAEAILRMNGRGPADQTEAVPDRTRDKGKRRHRRASSGNFLKADWTTKIYILVTSGYLLQYSGEGSFDRLPEKILPLGKESAAFASDVILGKHWVVQVSASMDSDGTATTDPRASILSRLPFRGPERRQASHFLMVFESAEEMDQWIAILRREIEHLGGKKNLSETGRPKADDERLELRTQASQRTLVLRDPGRFARPTVLDGDRWGIDEHPNLQDTQSTILTDSDTATDHQSFDEEMSATNSTTSHDGRQLENLRDGSNRLSFISSSQRTFLTSEGTSPACSPSRTSFSSQIEDGPFSNDGLLTEAKPRPNAHAILQRRMSMQAANPFADIQMAPQSQSSRPSRTCYLDGTHQSVTNTYCTRNFSMPHSANKRFSMISSPGSSPEPALELSPHATGLSAPPRPSSKRGPPPTLGFSRPLSMVPDHPSPISPPVLRKKNGDNRQWGLGANGPEPRSIFQIWAQEDSTKSPFAPQEVAGTDEPTRRASVHALMPSRMPRHSPNSQSRQQTHINNTLIVTTPEHGSVRPRSFASPGVSARSETDPQGHSGRAALSAAAFHGSPTPQCRSPPRSNVLSRGVGMIDHGYDGDAVKVNFGRVFYNDNPQELSPQPPPPMTEGPPSRPLPQPPTSQPKQTRQRVVRNSTSVQNLRSDFETVALSRRQSIKHLADGPPPAPPPTCALPPIPSSQGVKGRGRRAQTVAN